MLRIETKSDDALRALLPQLAQLRLTVFRDWPYLYDGTIEYEQRYLSKFIEAPNHAAVCALDGDKLVGASTASPLAHQYDELTQPFLNAGYGIGDVFYFGESILLPNYRGQGIGHAFFEGREAHAAALGYGKNAFCGVVRPADHPLTPDTYRPLDTFWQKRGYRPLEGLIAHFSWLDVGETKESEKPMQFWGRGF